MEIYLIRHTTPDIAKKVCYGQLDIGVKDSFQDEVDSLLKRVALNEAITCYASPLQRCASLAQALPFAQIEYDTRLQEMHFGEWEGIPWKDLDAETLRHWLEDFVNRRTPGGECYQDLYDRVTSFWEEMLQRQHEKVAIVTHGGVIRSLIVRVLEMPLKNLYHFDILFASVSKIDIERGREKVMYVNR